MHRYKSQLGMTAIALSFCALLLTIFPSSVILRKIIVLEQHCQEDNSAAYSFTLDKGEGCRSEAEKCAAEMYVLRGRLRLCKLALMLTAAAAIAMAICSWRKEQAKALCLYSIAVSSEVMFWPHIGTEFTVSIALMAFIVLAAKLS